MNLIISILTARTLGPHDRGIYSFLISLPRTIEIFLRFGIPQSNIFLIRKNAFSLSDISMNSLIHGICVGFLPLLLFLIFKGHILSKTDSVIPSYYLIMALAVVPFHLLDEDFISIFHAQNRFTITNTRKFSGTVILLLILLITLLVFNAGLSGAIITTFMVMYLFSSWMVITSYLKNNFSKKLHINAFKVMFSFGMKSYSQTLIQHMHLRLDIYMIAMLLQPEHVAFYSIASRMAELLLIIEHAVGTVLYPQLSSVREDVVHRMTATVCRHTCMLVTASAIILGFAGKTLILSWYGEAYREAATPFLIMLPGTLMLSLFYTVGLNFTSRQKQHVNIFCGLAALASNFGLNWFLIPRMGIAGAAIASTLSYTLAAILLLSFFKRESQQGLAAILCFQRGDVSVYGDLAHRLRLWANGVVKLAPFLR